MSHTHDYHQGKDVGVCLLLALTLCLNLRLRPAALPYSLARAVSEDKDKD